MQARKNNNYILSEASLTISIKAKEEEQVKDFIAHKLKEWAGNFRNKKRVVQLTPNQPLPSDLVDAINEQMKDSKESFPHIQDKLVQILKDFEISSNLLFDMRYCSQSATGALSATDAHVADIKQSLCDSEKFLDEELATTKLNLKSQLYKKIKALEKRKEQLNLNLSKEFRELCEENNIKTLDKLTNIFNRTIADMAKNSKEFTQDSFYNTWGLELGAEFEKESYNLKEEKYLMQDFERLGDIIPKLSQSKAFQEGKEMYAINDSLEQAKHAALHLQLNTIHGDWKQVLKTVPKPAFDYACQMVPKLKTLLNASNAIASMGCILKTDTKQKLEPIQRLHALHQEFQNQKSHLDKVEDNRFKRIISFMGHTFATLLTGGTYFLARAGCSYLTMGSIGFWKNPLIKTSQLVNHTLEKTGLKL